MKTNQYYPNYRIAIDKDDIYKDHKDLTIKTKIRKKHSKGFYYYVPVQIKQLFIEEISREYVITTALEHFIKVCYDIIMYYDYSEPDTSVTETGNNPNPIDPYQGDILEEYDPEKQFKFYDPDWSIGELLEVNSYMENLFDL